MEHCNGCKNCKKIKGISFLSYECIKNNIRLGHTDLDKTSCGYFESK
jgi:hypothetical protein